MSSPFKPNHGTFASPPKSQREQAAAVAAAMARPTETDARKPTMREATGAPAARAAARVDLGTDRDNLLRIGLHIGDALHRMADAMAARYELDLASDERTAKAWARFAELAERFAARMDRDDERRGNESEVTGGDAGHG